MASRHGADHSWRCWPSLHQSSIAADGKVVQILGGVGNSGSRLQATQLARDLAARIGAAAVLLQAPGVVASTEAKLVLANDPVVKEASALFGKIDLALVGIGTMTPSPLLSKSGNVFSATEHKSLRMLKAVGDICLRFFEESGKPVNSPLEDRVIGIDLNVLRKAGRVVGIAGGPSKRMAVRAVLLGGWINVLITDRATADFLLAEESRESH